ncbi:hypothetical protein LPJ62_002139, partial [Coemansia sp. RSA 2167]
WLIAAPDAAVRVFVPRYFAAVWVSISSPIVACPAAAASAGRRRRWQIGHAVAQDDACGQLQKRPKLAPVV